MPKNPLELGAVRGPVVAQPEPSRNRLGYSSASAFAGTKLMPQRGQVPGVGFRTSECIGHVYVVVTPWARSNASAQARTRASSSF